MVSLFIITRAKKHIRRDKTRLESTLVAKICKTTRGQRNLLNNEIRR
jgi:hypothetical protein